MRAQEDRDFSRVLDSADLCLPDGTGVVWAARRQGCSITEPVPGVDLIPPLAAMCARRGFRAGTGPRTAGAGTGGRPPPAAGRHVRPPRFPAVSARGGGWRGRGPGRADARRASWPTGGFASGFFGPLVRRRDLDADSCAPDPGPSRRVRRPEAGAVDRSPEGPVGGCGRDWRRRRVRLSHRPRTTRPGLDERGRLRVAAPARPSAVASLTHGRAAGFRLQGSERGQVGWRIVLSIVIPCYNEEERLPRTIEQIERYLDGRDVSYELLLVDDGSSDG